MKNKRIIGTNISSIIRYLKTITKEGTEYVTFEHSDQASTDRLLKPQTFTSFRCKTISCQQMILKDYSSGSAWSQGTICPGIELLTELRLTSVKHKEKILNIQSRGSYFVWPI